MDKIIFWGVLIAFPLGQIIRPFGINILDILVLILGVITLFKRNKFPDWYGYLLSFLIFGLFSFVVANFIFGLGFDFKALLYLVRLVAYSVVGIYVSNSYKSKKDKEGLLDRLQQVCFTVLVFGWIQYLFLPDTRFLKDFGWDDHLLRMVGTILDPTYLGLIFIIGAIISVYKKRNIQLAMFIVSIALTYSRSSYLSLFFVFVFIFIKLKNIKIMFFCLLIFLVSVLAAPKMQSEGTNLARTVSVNNKYEDYIQAMITIKKSPLLGVGYNNVCSYKLKYLNINEKDSHSCYGFDSSILFILSTTGFVGLMLFVFSLLKLKPTNDIFGGILTSSFLALLIHSLFANSMFYPHIMFLMFVLVGLGAKIDSQTS